MAVRFRFRIVHMFLLVTLAAGVCLCVSNRLVALHSLRHLEQTLVQAVEPATQRYAVAHPVQYEKIKNFEPTVIGPGINLRLFGKLDSYQFEIADASRGVYLVVSMPASWLSPNLSIEVLTIEDQVRVLTIRAAEEQEIKPDDIRFD